MVDVFEYQDYRTYLVSLVRERKARGETQSQLARAMRCQAAYLSQVLAGRADLTEEQLLRLAIHLDISETSLDYLLLLRRVEKAGDLQLRRYLEKQLIAMRESASELDGRLKSAIAKNDPEMSAYYGSSWIPSVIHILTSCPDFQTAKSISKRLNISENVVQTHLQKLEKFGLVDFDSDRWTFAGNSIHFGKQTDADSQLQTNRRLMAIMDLPKRSATSLHYSSVFATTSETALEIRHELLNVIESFHKRIEPTASGDVYTICIDAFSV